MKRTALTLLAVMLAAYAYSFGMPAIYDAPDWGYSAYMIGVNALACRMIVKHPAARWQSIIGYSMLVQIGVDGGNVAAQLYYGTSDAFLVYWLTTILAFAQLAMIGGWLLDGRFAGLGGYSEADSTLAPARRRGVA